MKSIASLVLNCSTLLFSKRILLAALIIGAAGTMAAQGCFSVGEDTRVQFTPANWARSESHDLFQWTEIQSLLTDDERLLSRDEWTYLFAGRDDAYRLYGRATVDSVEGLVILPDWNTWTVPEGLYFHYDDADEGYATNRYDSAEWTLMEQAGAAFLPASGYSLDGTEVLDAKRYGSYWTATPYGDDQAYCISFDLGYIYYDNMHSPCTVYRSVRTVVPWQPQGIDNANLQSEIINHKYIKDGHLLILRGDKTYTVTGAELK